MTQAALQDRQAREVDHFGAHYAAEAARGIEPLSEFDRRRYSNPPADTIFPREYYYHLLAPLAGKRTLEIACGNGIDASICAHNGAIVHAYDLSPESVDMTRRRAIVNGVSDRVHLEVTGDLEQAFHGEQFDAVIAYAALHHIPLENFAQRVRARLRPGGVAVFAEPVINSRALDALRRCIPYSPFPNTDDEHPLNDRQISDLAKPFDRMVRREFQCLSRLWPIFPNNWPLAVSLHWLDYYLLKVPALRRFASVVVFALYRDR